MNRNGQGRGPVSQQPSNGSKPTPGTPQRTAPDTPPQGTPRWETAVMVLSFVALWCWWLVLQRAQRTHNPLPAAWFLVLGLLVAALVYIFVRRSARVLAGLKDNARRK